MTARYDATADAPVATEGEPADSSESGVGRGERLAAAALGGALLTLGLRRRSLGGAAAALAGGALFYRGLSGRTPLSRLRAMRSEAGAEEDETDASDDGTTVERTITIGEPADELYELWRDPEALTRIVGRVADVSPAGEDRQRWSLRGPIGRTVAWETEIVEDRPGELLRWEAVEGAMVANEGSVRFRPAPGDRGTEVTLRLFFDPPGGALGDAAMKLVNVGPDVLAGTALRRFKSLAETGEIPTLERNPSARGKGDVV